MLARSLYTHTVWLLQPEVETYMNHAREFGWFSRSLYMHMLLGWCSRWLKHTSIRLAGAAGRSNGVAGAAGVPEHKTNNKLHGMLAGAAGRLHATSCVAGAAGGLKHTHI